MDEHVLAAILAGHEAEALLGIEPLDGTVERRRRRRVHRPARRTRRTEPTTAAEAAAIATEAARTRTTVATEAARTRTARRLRRRGRFIDLKHLDNLLALGALSHLNLQRRTRRHAVATHCLQLTDVQESVARTVGKRGKAETLLRVEPGYRRFHHRTSRGGAVIRRRTAETARRPLGTNVERRHHVVIKSATPPRRAEILTLTHSVFSSPPKHSSRPMPAESCIEPVCF